MTAQLTPEQSQCIKHLDGPLVVSAGAGSGKTFTLTQRIAYALSDESGPYLDDIGQLCAITYTNKAAEEIKARTRRMLRERGLFDQALKVDSAWISTIHGMCSRILHAHAFELHIDPDFDIIDDAKRSQLLSSAINSVLSGLEDDDKNELYPYLFASFDAAGDTFTTSVPSLVEDMVSKAAASPRGFDDIIVAQSPYSISDSLQCLKENFSAFAAQLASFADSDSQREYIKKIDAFQTEIDGFFARLPKGVLPFEDERLLLNEYAALLGKCPKGDGRLFRSDEPKEISAAFYAVLKRLGAELNGAVCACILEDLINLSKKVYEQFGYLKRQEGALDNDDLLILAYQVMSSHPEIACQYANRFKLFMVDEFQDTNEMQIELIRFFAGENWSHLCTVGDAQQSIYRFRGADIRVFRNHRETMISPEIGALSVELKDNFRSDGDVLCFVRDEFGQPQAFGDGFMDLNASPTRKSDWNPDEPRISLSIGINHERGEKDAILNDATQIARYFKRLHDQGRPLSDMVILLRSMSKSGIYAEALRAEGLSCVVAGGSGFAAEPVVQLVSSICSVLANPLDSQSIFALLSSDIFNLPADDLLALSTTLDKKLGFLKSRGITDGVFAVLTEDESAFSPRLMQCATVLRSGLTKARYESLYTGVKAIVVESGWLARLESGGTEGMAAAGNVMKALRFLKEREHESTGSLSTIAREFRTFIESSPKENPGVLSAKTGEAVRLLTIHSSKGLEFNVVAVAEFEGITGYSSTISSIKRGTKEFCSISTGKYFSEDGAKTLARSYAKDLSDSKDIEKLFSEMAASPSKSKRDNADFAACIAAISNQEDKEESFRCFYVACTRAREALFVAARMKHTKSSGLTCGPITETLMHPWFIEGTPPETSCSLRLSNGSAFTFIRTDVYASKQDCDGDLPGQDALLRNEYEYASLPRIYFGAFKPRKMKTFSYSSISTHGYDEVVPAYPHVDFIDEDSAGADNPDKISSDTDRATDFGSAFHRAAQYAIETDTLPDEHRIRSLERKFSLSDSHCARLRRALARWFGCELFKQVSAYSIRKAEVPFFIEFDGLKFEGEIDALCYGGPDRSGHALLIDYKTGGKPEETEAQLYAKHLLQGQCYAYALLLNGFDEVEECFVRVERPSVPEDGGQFAEPQVVKYSYNASDIDELRAAITMGLEAKGLR